jgi:hypothetical protein
MGQEPPAPAAAPEPAPEPEPKSLSCGHEHRANAPEYNGARQSIQRSYIGVIRDAMERVMRRERNDIMKAGVKALKQRGVSDLENFIRDFYTEHEEFTREQIGPAFRALAEAVGAEALREIDDAWEWTTELEDWLADYVNAFANRHSNRSRQQLLDLIAATVEEGDDVLDALTTRFDQWEGGIAEGTATRAEKIAAENSVRLGQGFAREAMFAAGAVAMIVVNTGDETCPYCTALAGKRVGYTEPILRGGEDFAPGGASPLTPSHDVFHPPFHGGCDCMLISGV